MEPLLLSSLVLLAGPLLARVLARDARLTAVLDGFLIAALIGLVIVHILPHSVVEAGPVALVLFTIGLFVPVVWERVVQRTAGSHTGLLYILFVVGGLAHGLLDGAALHDHGGHAHDDQGRDTGLSTLALGVVLHRFPVGIALYTLVRPMFGNARTLILGIAYLGSTALGSVEAVHALVESMGLALGSMNALIAGSLLHGIVLHRPEATSIVRSLPIRRASGVGGLLALLFLAVFTRTHPVTAVVEGDLAPGETFLLLLTRSAPVLLLGFVLVGALFSLLSNRAHFLTEGRARTSTTRSPVVGALLGALEGAPYPLCSCSVEPLYRGIAGGPLSSSSAIAFLVAAPVIGVPATLLTLVFFGAEVTAYRVGCALALAVLTGVLVGRLMAPRRARLMQRDMAACAHRERPRIVEGLRYGFVESVDHMGPWFFLGIGVGALLEPLMSASVVDAIPAGFDVPLFALLGAPLYVCAAGITPLAVVLVHKGVSLGALFALMLAGPACNLGTLRLLAELHGRRVAVAYAFVVVIIATFVGIAVNTWSMASLPFDLHRDAEMPPSSLSIAAVIVVVVLAVLSLLRQGVRGALEQIIGGHDHAHDADGHCLLETDERVTSTTMRIPFQGGVRRASARPPIRLERIVTTEQKAHDEQR